MKKDIHIRKDGTADDCILDSVNQDQANWINDGDYDRKVVFQGRTPFAQQEYTVSAHSAQSSGEIVTTEKGAFPYTMPLASASNQPAADPHIIIR